MADIKIGNLEIDNLKVGTLSVDALYIGDVKIYPSTPPTPTYQGFCKLTLNDSSVVELEGSGELTDTMTSSYQSTAVSAEIGTLCTSIGQWAFYECKALESVTIGNSVTSIGDYVFSYCSSLTSVTIGDSVTNISSGAFNGCRSLTSIDIPSSVTIIDRQAFSSTGLKSINIPSSVTYIGDNAFRYCTSLTSVTVEPTTPPSLGNYVFDDTNDCPIYVPSTSVNTYKSAWSNYASRIQAIQ